MARSLTGKGGEALDEDDYEKLFPYFTWVVRNAQL